MILAVTKSREGMMPKKRTEKDEAAPERLHASQIRIQTLEVSDIKLKLGYAREWIAQIEGHLVSAGSNNIEEITIDGATKLGQAVKLLEEFSTNVYRGVARAITEKRMADRPSED